MSATNFDGKPKSDICKSMSKELFLLSQLQYIINIDTNAHIKPHIDYASVVWDGCGEVHLKKLNSIHRRAGKLILSDPSLSTEQKMNALGILNLLRQLAYNKGIFMHKVFNNSPNYLAQLFIIVNSPTKLTPGITSTCQGQGLSYLKLAYILRWSVPVFLFLVSNVICTNRCLRITFRQIWTDLFETHICLKNKS